jgi:hypothetical protein
VLGGIAVLALVTGLLFWFVVAPANRGPAMA